jgi:alpha-amylase
VTWHCSGLAGRCLTTRLNLAMPSCDGFLGRYVLADGSVPGGFGQPIDLPDMTTLTLEDGVLGGSIRLSTRNPAEICGRPQLTVSQSEAGFEKIMQAVELSVRWTLPDDQCTLQLQLTTQ